MNTNQGKVAVAMSGGVDSSVAAHILQQRGFSVHGVFITIWNPPHIPCTAAEDRLDAMRACAALKIPFMEYDASAVYEKEVIRPFVESYRRGDTPNPDILCNMYVKFGAVYDFLRKKGFPKIATGHYARVKRFDGTIQLYRAVDDDKDQTYFIHTIGRDILNTVLFPVGEYTKQQVREYAAEARLPAAEKKDSTGLCFLGAVSMKDFLSAYITPRDGVVYLADDDGHAVGTHDGAWFYTVGQRHGFTITTGDREPHIVVGKDVERNALFVCKQKDYTPTADTFRITDTVFRLPPDGELVARYRHRGALHQVSVRQESPTSAAVTFREPHLIAPGQSVVLYTPDGICIGGGTVAHGISP